jgi:pyridoxamine--pyruvate transaminase
MGLDVWARTDAIAGSCATAVTLPDNLTDAEVTRHCRERYGVMLSGSYGAGNLVRIGHMGLSARSLHPVVGLASLGRTLADLGVSVEIGAGVEAALASIAESEPVLT